MLHPPEYGLNLLALQLEGFESYILSHEVYWPLHQRAPAGSTPYPRLTIGTTMLNINEVTAQLDLLSSSQENEYFRLILIWDDLRQNWRSAIERKALQELRSRLNLWTAYLDEFEKGKDSGYSYQQEVRHRVIIAQLTDFLLNRPDFLPFLEQTQKLDDRLWSLFKPGPFLWHAALRDMYPADSYRFLYGFPVPPK